MKNFIFYLEKKIIPPLIRISKIPVFEALQKGMFKSLSILILSTLILFIFSKGAILIRMLNSFRASLVLMAGGITLIVPFYLFKNNFKKSFIISLNIFILYLILSFPLKLNNFLIYLQNISGAAIFIALILVLIYYFLIKSLNRFKDNIFINFIPFFLIYFLLYFLEKNSFNLYNLIFYLIAPLLKAADSLPVLLFLIFLNTLLWLGGIHGPSVIGPLVAPVYLTILGENAQAFTLKEPIPHIVSTVFFNIIFVGGAGSTLSLCILMLNSTSKKLSNLAKISLLPSLANLNEILIFGIPIVLNPIFFIPFLIIPLILALINYLIMYFNLVTRPYLYIPGIIPSPIAAYLSTGGDWKAAFLTILNIFISGLLYYPFLKVYEKKLKNE
ncbi:MAG: PTS sugar transporter subunit IIC [Armatimonadetes bacterium]|nr:PTS sugar transporter subunit IIC [Armatimonadota bacterium]